MLVCFYTTSCLCNSVWHVCLPCDTCVCVCLQVIDEVTGGLEGWAAKNRWEDLGIVQQVQQHPELQWAY